MKNSIKKLRKAFKNDEEYRNAWIANIAMSFKDEYDRERRKKKYLNSQDIHKIANNAADEFLKILCMKSK